jgi:sialate O-acetylesterase
VPAVGKGNVINLLVPHASQASTLKIRYAWKDDPKQANVRSLSGLPMSSFEITIK